MILNSSHQLSDNVILICQFFLRAIQEDRDKKIVGVYLHQCGVELNLLRAKRIHHLFQNAVSLESQETILIF
jgi:hypothetical protein